MLSCYAMGGRLRSTGKPASRHRWGPLEDHVDGKNKLCEQCGWWSRDLAKHTAKVDGQMKTEKDQGTAAHLARAVASGD